VSATSAQTSERPDTDIGYSMRAENGSVIGKVKRIGVVARGEGIVVPDGMGWDGMELAFAYVGLHTEGIGTYGTVMEMEI